MNTNEGLKQFCNAVAEVLQTVCKKFNSNLSNFNYYGVLHHHNLLNWIPIDTICLIIRTILGPKLVRLPGKERV